MNRVFARRVNDDFEAEQMAKAMLDAGCEVISITFNGMNRRPGALADTASFMVFGYAHNRGQIDATDEAFGKWLNSLTPQSI
jgi:hypothetical protein